MAGVRVRGEGRREREREYRHAELRILGGLAESHTQGPKGSGTTASQQRQESNETLDEPGVP